MKKQFLTAGFLALAGFSLEANAAGYDFNGLESFFDPVDFGGDLANARAHFVAPVGDDIAGSIAATKANYDAAHGGAVWHNVYAGTHGTINLTADEQDLLGTEAEFKAAVAGMAYGTDADLQAGIKSARQKKIYSLFGNSGDLLVGGDDATRMATIGAALHLDFDANDKGLATMRATVQMFIKEEGFKLGTEQQWRHILNQHGGAAPTFADAAADAVVGAMLNGFVGKAKAAIQGDIDAAWKDVLGRSMTQAALLACGLDANGLVAELTGNGIDKDSNKAAVDATAKARGVAILDAGTMLNDVAAGVEAEADWTENARRAKTALGTDNDGFYDVLQQVPNAMVVAAGADDAAKLVATFLADTDRLQASFKEYAIATHGAAGATYGASIAALDGTPGTDWGAASNEQKSWRLMRAIMNTAAGHSVVYKLIDALHIHMNWDGFRGFIEGAVSADPAIAPGNWIHVGPLATGQPTNAQAGISAPIVIRNFRSSLAEA